MPGALEDTRVNKKNETRALLSMCFWATRREDTAVKREAWHASESKKETCVLREGIGSQKGRRRIRPEPELSELSEMGNHLE